MQSDMPDVTCTTSPDMARANPIMDGHFECKYTPPLDQIVSV